MLPLKSQFVTCQAVQCTLLPELAVYILSTVPYSVQFSAELWQTAQCARTVDTVLSAFVGTPVATVMVATELNGTGLNCL
jgi:hypothetical protein